MAAHGFVAVVGARVLPEQVAPQVADVVGFFLSRGWGIGSGGARGADAFALQAVLAAGPAACARSVVFLPGVLGGAPIGALGSFAERGGLARACGISGETARQELAALARLGYLRRVGDGRRTQYLLA